MNEPYLWGSHDRELARQEAIAEVELAEREANMVDETAYQDDPYDGVSE
jgi:hypothetical protein